MGVKCHQSSVKVTSLFKPYPWTSGSLFENKQPMVTKKKNPLFVRGRDIQIRRVVMSNSYPEGQIFLFHSHTLYRLNKCSTDTLKALVKSGFKKSDTIVYTFSKY